jgi:hypothetical protein
VIDAHSCLWLSIRMSWRRKAKDPMAVLEKFSSLSLALAFNRSDNGPEFICPSVEASHFTGSWFQAEVVWLFWTAPIVSL